MWLPCRRARFGFGSAAKKYQTSRDEWDRRCLSGPFRFWLGPAGRAKRHVTAGGRAHRATGRADPRSSPTFAAPRAAAGSPYAAPAPHDVTARTQAAPPAARTPAAGTSDRSSAAPAPASPAAAGQTRVHNARTAAAAPRGPRDPGSPTNPRPLIPLDLTNFTKPHPPRPSSHPPRPVPLTSSLIKTHRYLDTCPDCPLWAVSRVECWRDETLNVGRVARCPTATSRADRLECRAAPSQRRRTAKPRARRSVHRTPRESARGAQRLWPQGRDPAGLRQLSLDDARA